MSEDEICLVAHVKTKLGQEAALSETVSAIVLLVRRQPRCLGFTARIGRDAPGTVVMREVWADRAAPDAHSGPPAL